MSSSRRTTRSSTAAATSPGFSRSAPTASPRGSRTVCSCRRRMSINPGSPARSVRTYGDLLILGGETHSTGSQEATPDRFEQLERFAREHWDVVDITHRWSAQDPVPYDHLPMIGPYHPLASRVWVSTGFMKWGMTSTTFGAM